ncbi:hypothetical protein A6764_01895 [Brevibacillus sp. WF146]|uniref:hypothetical protein n=1 Tax=Brevibacillus sp. WF146 TaxID=319501 RepID=UPI000ABCF3DA|nr:hypothetical protein [Brevibacillus sp. WF146]UYZ13762.1 hypothetical protein A6764_01895 [Brevibacillus sp. WF146]
MFKKKRTIVASTLTTVLLFNLVTPVLAKGEETSTVERRIALESLSKLNKSFQSVNSLTDEEIAKKIFENLSPEAQQKFIEFMIKQSEAGDTSLIEFHEKAVGKVQKKVGKKSTSISQKSVAKAASEPLDILSYRLGKLNLPRPVYYSMMAVGGGIAAAAVDGPLPIGDIIGVITAVGAGVVVGIYWDEVEAKFDGIVGAFKAAFSSMASKIETAFNTLYAEAIIYFYDIPKKLLNDDGDGVDLGKFTQPVKGRKAYRDPKTGWEIDADKAGEKSHGGSAWKLKNPKGKRVATLDKKGKILRD